MNLTVPKEILLNNSSLFLELLRDLRVTTVTNFCLVVMILLSLDPYMFFFHRSFQSFKNVSIIGSLARIKVLSDSFLLRQVRIDH